MIKIDKEEKKMVLEYFPRTKFVRTCKTKSKRHHYYMAEEKDQLRFLSGVNKTQRNFSTDEIIVIVPGCPYINENAIKAFELLLINNILYYDGEIGGMSNSGELLTEEQVAKSNGLKKFCEYELIQLRRKFPNICKG